MLHIRFFQHIASWCNRKKIAGYYDIYSPSCALENVNGWENFCGLFWAKIKIFVLLLYVIYWWLLNKQQPLFHILVFDIIKKWCFIHVYINLSESFLQHMKKSLCYDWKVPHFYSNQCSVFYSAWCLFFFLIWCHPIYYILSQFPPRYVIRVLFHSNSIKLVNLQLWQKDPILLISEYSDGSQF